MSRTISVFIPALNEGLNLSSTKEKVISTLAKRGFDYEIIIVNDGSSDETGEVADELSSKDERVVVIHHDKPMGIGSGYREALDVSNGHFFLMIPGDDDVESAEIDRILKLADHADIVIPFIENQKCRPLMRRLYSNLFTHTLNAIFRLDIKYYNGPVLHKIVNLKRINFRSRKFTYQAEILIKLIKNENCSFKHTGFRINERKHGESKAVRLSNFVDVLLFIILLFCEVILKTPMREK